ncbi:MAG TPA: hypothetical protein VHD61_15050 [Lacunisphaera sp.]|nr:hypothetical protein [Lacunisphaera sp.]
MPSYLEPLDPEILKDSLPADIHAIVDQVTTNVNQAVGDLIQRFRDNAGKVAEDFKNAKFDGEMKAAIDAELNKLTASLNDLQGKTAAATAACARLQAAAAAAAPGALTAEIAALGQASADLTTTLTNFQGHVNKLAGNLGGAIASTAVKLIGGL